MKVRFDFFLPFNLAVILLSAVSCGSSGQDDAIGRLDLVLADKGRYAARFEDELLAKRRQLELSGGQEWNLILDLYESYRCYDIDSAYVYATALKSLSDTKEEETVAVCALCDVLCARRDYSQAESLLDGLDTVLMSDSMLKLYYNARIGLCTAMSNEQLMTKTATDTDISRDKWLHHERLLALSCLDDYEKAYFKGKQLMIEGDYQQALDSLQKALSLDPDIKDALHTTYAIANCHKAMGDRDNFRKWLAETAILDLTIPFRQYRSLYDLAICLYEDGEYARAEEYIQTTVIDAIACKYPIRTFNAVEAQRIIGAAREHDAKQKNILAVIMIVLALTAVAVVSAALFRVNRQRKRLKTLMCQLKEVNHELSQKNAIITEANIIKEKYMFRYMFLSANFIRSIEDYRHSLRSTFKTEGSEGLMAKLREPDYMYMQYKSFYKLFDEIFLGIFPNFLEKVNELLRPEERMVMKSAETMPTELRILAVLRLGMTESRRIAEFLNQSVNTVYRYRTKMRYASILPPDEFEEKVKEIDCFK